MALVFNSRSNDIKAAAVLLAAGLSRRMGERNKLLVEIGGEPLVRRTAKRYLEAGIDVHVVAGHEAALVRRALEGLPITIAENPNYEEGQPSSVRKGIESLCGNFDAIFVALSDQAALTAEDLRNLLGAFSESGGSKILVPYYGGQRGNPAIFPGDLIAAMKAANRVSVSRTFIDQNPDLIFRYEAPNDHVTFDIDTPEDLAAFVSQEQRQRERR